MLPAVHDFHMPLKREFRFTVLMNVKANGLVGTEIDRLSKVLEACDEALLGSIVRDGSSFTGVIYLQ